MGTSPTRFSCGGGGCSSNKRSGGGGGGFNYGLYLKQKKARADRRTEKLLRLEILSEYMDPLDKNNDGSLTLDEFAAGEKSSGVKARFDAANKNGDRYLTKTEIAKMIDLEAQMKNHK